MGLFSHSDPDKIDALKEQHELKKHWKTNNPDADLKPMTLDQNRVTISFKQVKTIL